MKTIAKYSIESFLKIKEKKQKIERNLPTMISYGVNSLLEKCKFKILLLFINQVSQNKKSKNKKITMKD